MPTHPAGRHRRPAWGEFLALPENTSALRAVRSLYRSLARAVPRVLLSPLVLHGPSGSGKSHLIRSLIEKLATADEVVTVQSLPAADLARGMAPTGGEELEPTVLDESFQECDLLVIEDFQQLSAKSAESMCLLLDNRSSRRRGTVLTLNVGPALLSHLPRRLTSRLAAGLVVPLDPLSPASRKRLLKAEAKKRNVKLTKEAVDWLAAQATGGGFRPLLGTLNNLAPLARQQPLPLDRPQVEEYLKSTGQPMASAPLPAEIVKRVAAHFQMPVKDLLGPSRLRPIRQARQVAMYLVREVTDLSLPRIGVCFEGRDHTTVLHACRRVEEEMAADKLFAGRVRSLLAEMR